MFKNIIMSLLLCTYLSAESFDEFLQKAIKNSPYLESSALAVQQTKEEGDILTRYKNPTFEVEYSEFESNVGSSDDGYRINYSQPIRLWSVGDDKVALVNANIKSVNASYSQKRAIFVRDLSLLYSDYSKAKKLLKLGAEEIQIAKKIYDISVARLESGSISKSLKLQAQVDYEITANRKETLSLSTMNFYFNILKFAGINEEVEIEGEHDFSIDINPKSIQNPTVKVFQAQQNQALRKAKLNSNTIEWVNLFAELENEPDQDVFRVGLNFPLAFFNDKSQEKSIAILQANRSELLIQNEQSRLNMEIARLQRERQSLVKLNEKSKNILKTQLRLLTMYEEGYKIASISLLQLQDIKNKVIETRRRLIEINTALNKNAIYTNYNQGNYNE
jgi:outer membrane protein, heavy metal efflux system